MQDLIEALQIFAKYTDTKYPTHCEHDIMYIMDVGGDDPTEEEKIRLEELGFDWDEDEDVWYSFKFGSA